MHIQWGILAIIITIAMGMAIVNNSLHICIYLYARTVDLSVLMRCSSISTAKMWPLLRMTADRWAVLLPGAAHASNTAHLGRGSNACTGKHDALMIVYKEIFNISGIVPHPIHHYEENGME